MHDLNCQQALERVYEFLDQEITEEQADEIRMHLAACEPCFDEVETRVALKALIKRCCSGERAPDALRLRIVTEVTRMVRFD